MFDSEDFDLDEDFLNDVGQKEEEYYSQKIGSEKNSPKRRKIEEIDFLSDTSFDDEPDFAKFASKSMGPAAKKSEKRETVQTKISSEEILQERQSGRNEINSKINHITRNLEKESSEFVAKCESIENVEMSRRKLALEILKKGGAARENVSTEKNSPTRSGSLVQSQSLKEKNSRLDDEQRRRKNLEESFKKPLAKVSNSNSSWTKANEQTRRKSLLESLKKPRAQVSKSPDKFRGETNSAKNLMKDGSLGIARVTRVRKFPGPAGLLPDCPEGNFESVNFLNRLEAGNMVERSEEREDSGMSEYLSQTTEKLFSAGAWQSMLEDLPEGFLRGHEIATMKKTAKNNSRVSLLAGVIARIDHAPQNPRLILKDLSDSIEATMHPDILLAHPNIFEPGVVVLLRHVGVLAFQASPIFPTLQFHVMIAAKNIGAVYSEKSRIVTSPWIETILGTSRDSSIPRPEESTKKSSFIEDAIDMSDFESDDDTFVSFNIDDLAYSQTASNSLKFSLETVAHASPADKIVRNNEIRSKIAQPERNPSSLGSTEQFVTERCSGAITMTENPKKPSLPTEPKKTTNLTQFQGQHDSETRSSEPPIELSDPPHLPKEIDSNPTGFGDNLMDSDNDTEDEILSQLDVDSIVTTYNSQT